MEGKRGRRRPRQKLLDWMMSEGYSKRIRRSAPSRNKVIACLDLPWQRVENLKKEEPFSYRKCTIFM